MHILKKLQPYKIETLALLFNETPLKSIDVFLNLEKTMGDKHPSRASVINFLNSLVDNHHVTYEFGTGKGGHHRIYTLKGNRDDFTTRLQTQLLKEFHEEYLLSFEAV